MSVIRQPSLFGAESSAPEVADLAGLLLAGATAVAGSPQLGVQLTVVVDHPWRASVLVMECARRGLPATTVSTVEQRIGVRTVYSPLLLPLANRWTDGTAWRTPAGLILDGRVLRLWVAAAGRHDGADAYTLVGGPGDEVDRQRIEVALAAVGCAAQSVLARRGGGGYTYRIVGRRRLDRLAEMVADPPKQAPADIWPS